MVRLRRPDDGGWRVTLTVVTILLLVVVVVALILRTFAWRAQWLLVAAALVHYLLWLAPVALLLAALNRRWITTVVAAAATVLVLLVQVPPDVAVDVPTEGRSVTVLQANLKLGRADPDALVRLVHEHRVDLLATEELTTSEVARLDAAGLPKLLPHRYLRPLFGGGSGSGIWSRWPISGQQDVLGFYLSVVRASVAAPGGRFSFVGVHLTPPWPFPTQRWLGELPRLRTLLDDQPDDTVIAAGDYNATVDHEQFRGLLTNGYRDAAQDAGAGYLPSYPNDRWFGPVIGIDHVLLRNAYGAAARTLELPGSDHRALLVDVSVSGR